MYGILLNKDFGMTRDKLREELLKEGIDTRSFFIPMHGQPVFQKKSRKFAMPDVNGSYPVSGNLGTNGFYLPSSSSLPKEDIIFITDAIKNIKENIKK